MVFKKKLSGSAPRVRCSPQHLAHELEVALSVVVESLRAVGEYVDSPRKRVIEEPVVKKVYTYLDREYTPEPSRTVSGWKTRDSSVPTETRRSRSQVHRMDQVGARSSFGSKDESLGLGDRRSDAADAWANEEWKVYGFTPGESDSWRGSGLRRGQAKLAAEFRDAGLLPSDLSEVVSGWSVAKRLRSGEAPAQVVRLLKATRTDGEAV